MEQSPVLALNSLDLEAHLGGIEGDGEDFGDGGGDTSREHHDGEREVVGRISFFHLI